MIRHNSNNNKDISFSSTCKKTNLKSFDHSNPTNRECIPTTQNNNDTSKAKCDGSQHNLTNNIKEKLREKSRIDLLDSFSKFIVTPGNIPTELSQEETELNQKLNELFHEYESDESSSSMDGENSTSYVSSLTWDQEERKNKLMVTDMVFGSCRITGDLLLVVSYGDKYGPLSPSLFGHNGAVLLWNVSSCIQDTYEIDYRAIFPTFTESSESDSDDSGKNKEMKPSKIIQHSNSINCISSSSHPLNRNLYAVGSQHGEILLIDFSLAVDCDDDDDDDDTNSMNDNLSSSTSNDGKECIIARTQLNSNTYGHYEPITALHWYQLPSPSSHKSSSSPIVWALCSTSGDGRVLFWNCDYDISNKSSTLSTAVQQNLLKYPLLGISLTSQLEPSSKYATKSLGLSLNKQHASSPPPSFSTISPINCLCYGGTALTTSSSNDHNNNIISINQHISPIHIGTETGKIICLQIRQTSPLSTCSKPTTTMKWSKNALLSLSQITADLKNQVIEQIETKTKLKQHHKHKKKVSSKHDIGDKQKKTKKKEGIVDLSCVYTANIPPHILFPSYLNNTSSNQYHHDDEKQKNFFHSEHSSYITQLDLNPFCNNLLLSCSLDGEVKIYNTSDDFLPSFSSSNLSSRTSTDMDSLNLILHLEPCYSPPSSNPPFSGSPPYIVWDAKFSRTKPTVFACASQNGHVYLYDLQASFHSPIQVLDIPPPFSNLNTQHDDIGDKDDSIVQETEKPGILCIAFHDLETKKTMMRKRFGCSGQIINNIEGPEIFATGDTHGVIHLWKLPTHLWHTSSSCIDNDISFLKKSTHRNTMWM